MRRCAVITRLVKAGAGAYLAPIDSRTRRHAVESPTTPWHHNPWSCPVFNGSSSLPDTKCQGPLLTGGQEVAGSNPASPTERTLAPQGFSLLGERRECCPGTRSWSRSWSNAVFTV